MSTKAPLKRRLRSLAILLIYPLVAVLTVLFVVNTNFLFFLKHCWEDVAPYKLKALFIGHLKLLLKGEYSD